MEIDIQKLNAFFSPNDPAHLLLVWGIMTAFLLVYASMVGIIGIYATVWRLWKVFTAVLGSLYFFSAIGFLVLRMNVLIMMMFLLLIAFIILGDVAVKERDDGIEGAGLAGLFTRRVGKQVDGEMDIESLPIDE